MPFEGDPYAFYGKLIVEEADALLSQKLEAADIELQARVSDPILSHFPRQKVGIIGGGIGGLYTALILKSLGIEYEIIEASDHVGGRVSTHEFKENGKIVDYYDAGAMRFPLPKKDGDKYKNGVMKRLAELIKYVNIEGTLIPYYYEAREEVGDKPAFYYFNGVHKSVPGKTGQPHQDNTGFKAKEMGVGERYIKAGTDRIFEDVLNPFVHALVDDLKTGTKDGWKALQQFDAYSVRTFMASKYLPTYTLKLPPRHLPNNVINWCNLVEESSGGYDRAFSEAVFDAMAFASGGEIDFGVDWKCFQGGTRELTKAVENQVGNNNTKLNKRVTSIEQTFKYYLIPGNYDGGKPIPTSAKETPLPNANNPKYYRIDIDDDTSTHWRLIRHPRLKVITDSDTHVYHHVVTTLSPPVLRTIGLKKAGLHVLQSNALRALDYGPSVKVAIRFKTAWWTEKLKIFGGQSFTDLPIRTVVYPSYLNTDKKPSTVLIVSYTWTTDASRLGALAMRQDTLKELVLRNLAEAHHGVHGVTEPDGKTWYEFLKGQLAGSKLEDYFHVKDWSVDEYTMGAFAQFSPGEFEDLYTSLTVPAADGTLHFGGEAVSTRHGWIVGSLDSGWRVIDEYLRLTGDTKKLEEFHRKWGGNSEWTTRPSVTKKGDTRNLHEKHISWRLAGMHSGII